MPDAPNDAAELVADFAQLRQDLMFLRSLRELRVATSAGDVTIQIDPESGNASLDLRALTPSATQPASQLPAQTGNSGKVLTTDGTTPAWG